MLRWKSYRSTSGIVVSAGTPPAQLVGLIIGVAELAADMMSATSMECQSQANITSPGHGLHKWACGILLFLQWGVET